MTSTLSLTKKKYFGLWNKVEGGRMGNNMATTVTNIVEEIQEDHPPITDLTLGSDDCVSQNKLNNASDIFICPKYASNS